LLLAGNALQKKFPDHFFYFPSYEIVMDELRDYRFYAEDMIHTSEQTTSYIWEKFRQVLLSESSTEFIKDLEQVLKLKEHRPRDKSSEAHRTREDQLRERVASLKTKYSEFDLGDIL